MVLVQAILATFAVTLVMTQELNTTSRAPISRHFSPNNEAEAVHLNLNLVRITSTTTTKFPAVLREEVDEVIGTFSYQSPKKNVFSSWSPFSCCRRTSGTMGRTRIYSYYLLVQSRVCYSNYCPDTCSDDFSSCQNFRVMQNACESPRYYGFMNLHCALTCGRCQPSPTLASTITTPFETTIYSQTAEIVQVQVYFTNSYYLNYYTYTTSQSSPGSPWRPVAQSINPGEVPSFYLYSQPIPPYDVAIYFCYQLLSDLKVMRITDQACRDGWIFDFLLYSSRTRNQNSDYLLVSDRSSAPMASRVHRGVSCCGYQRNVRYFYPLIRGAPTPSLPMTTTPPVTVSQYRPFTTPSTQVTPTTSLALTPLQRECVDHHNFYRALHNASPLQWDNELFLTAQSWARFLLQAAPEDPHRSINGATTPNWPHSEKGTQYRRDGVGENIAWDWSIEGSSVHESILRWYLELFDYNPQSPISRNPRKPTGHYSQLLWKQTTKVACATAHRTIYKGLTPYIATYTVAHYHPLGNIYYTSSERPYQAFDANVQPLNTDACRSPSPCAAGGCVGFTSTARCSCAGGYFVGYGGMPYCSGECAVVCVHPSHVTTGLPYNWHSECRGRFSCRCSYQMINNRFGAICDQ